MNKINVEVVEVGKKKLSQKHLDIKVETLDLDFNIPRTMSKYTMVPTEELQALEEKAWMYDQLNK